MNDTNFTSTVQPNHNADYSTARRLVGVWELIIFLVGFPANAFVIYLACVMIRTKSRTNNQWFILSMTTADLLFTLFHSPIQFAQFSIQGAVIPCYFVYIITYTCTTASSLSLLCLNIDKFICIHKPLHYFIIVTKVKIFIAIAVVWTTSIVWALFFLLGPFIKHTPPCDFRPQVKSLYVFFAMFFFTVPIVLSLMISIYIATIVFKSKKARRIRETRYLRSRSDSEDKSPTTSGSSGDTALSQLRTISFVFTTTIWSSISCLPYRITYIVSILKTFNATEFYFSYFFFALMATNALGNPFVTVFSQHQYTQKIKEMMGRIALTKMPSVSTHYSTSINSLHSIIESRKTSAEKRLSKGNTVCDAPL